MNFFCKIKQNARIRSSDHSIICSISKSFIITGFNNANFYQKSSQVIYNALKFLNLIEVSLNELKMLII